jgi:hypothetical protein
MLSLSLAGIVLDTVFVLISLEAASMNSPWSILSGRGRRGDAR